MKNHTYEVEVNGWDYKLFCDGVCYFSAEAGHKGEKEMENLIITDVYEEEQNVKIEGYSGRWSAIERTEYKGAVYYWYENNRYGDETCYLVGEWVDGILMRVFETYDGLEQCLIDEEIIQY